MNEAFRTLCEDLPERRVRSGAFPTDARSVRSWIDALPRANPAQTQRHLSDALAALATMKLSGGTRLLVMEALRPVLLETTRSLAQKTQLSTLPLPPAKARAMEQLRGFESDLALAYRLAVVELCGRAGRVPLFGGSRVATALTRALYHQSRGLAHAYALYQTPAAGSWRMLHALHAFAASHRLQDRSIFDAAAGATSVRRLYLQALLLALSNPYRFTQKEQGELWDLLGELAPHTRLHAGRPGEDAFAIPVDSDEGPGYIAEERADDRGRLLWFELTALRRALTLPSIDAGSGPVRLRLGSTAIDASAELLRRVRSGWGTAAERSHQRLSAGHGLQTVIGLGGVHLHLADGEDFDAFLRRAGLGTPAGERDRHEWTHAALGAERVPLARAEVLDQSLGGYRVRWPADQQVRARVGELIGLGIVADGEPPQWLLGVIRWLRYAPDGGVDGGIELLARRARPVAIRSLDPPADRRPRLRGIEFEPLRGGDAGELRLVVPSVLESLGGDVELVRVADAAALDHHEPTSERCRNLRITEATDEFQLVAVERATAAA